MTTLKLISAILIGWIVSLSIANAIAAAAHEDVGPDDDREAPSSDHLVDTDVIGNEAEKRAMGALRLGRAGSRQSNNNRAMSALRLGRRGDWATDSFDVEDGLDPESEKTKRKSMSMLRLGRAYEDQPTQEEVREEEEKKAMSALRLGRKRGLDGEVSGDAADKGDVEKRAMGMLRLGRGNGGRDSETAVENTRLKMDRRKSMSMLRLG